MKNRIKVSAPGRICLFGEHQDYLGLPVITAAIDLRLELTAAIQTR
jgi:galactokinase